MGNYSAFVGFDGYIDEIFKPKTGLECFESIKHFNDYLIRNGSASADISVNRIGRRMGGNAPLLAYSLARKGLKVHCAGAFGQDKLFPIFAPLEKCCKIITVADPAECYAFEFPDGKIMFGEHSSLDKITPKVIRKKIGEKLLAKLLQSDLICFVNWSGILHGNEILYEILLEGAKTKKGKKQILFLDLADLSVIESTRVSELIALLAQLGQRYYTTLGLNKKEALIFIEHCGIKAASLPKMAEMLRIRLGVDENYGA